MHASPLGVKGYSKIMLGFKVRSLVYWNIENNALHGKYPSIEVLNFYLFCSVLENWMYKNNVNLYKVQKENRIQGT